MEPIPAKELDQYVGKRGIRIIDLRGRQEYARGHIRGAINAPDGKFGSLFSGFRQDILILYCERGALSMAVARDLGREGWQTKTVVGGIRAYRGANLVGH